MLRAHDRRDGRGKLGVAGDGRGADGDTAALAAALRLAPERGELGLRYQPVLDTRRRRVDGVELLLRWRHPAQGAIPPDRFIPLADELGLLDAMALWSLRRAATELAPLLGRRHGGCDDEGLGVYVNLSARQVRADFARELAPHLLALGAPRVVVEVTEGALLEDAPEVEEALALLRGAGIGVAVDDFGTGYSSLAYLDRFPAVGALKVDRRFVAKIGRDGPGGAALVEAILAMAEALGLEVVAEGVETEAQLAWLAARGCPYLQGFLIAPPLTVCELAGFLDDFRFPEGGAAAPAPGSIDGPARLGGTAGHTRDDDSGGGPDRARHEAGARQREGELLRRTVEALPDLVYCKDRDGRFLVANRAMAASVGVADPRGLIGLSDTDLHPPELAARYRADEERIMTGGEPVLIEQPVRRPDGGEGWVWSLKAPLKDDQGQVVGLVGHGRDITAWKAAEEAARAAEAEAGRARAMLEGAAEILADGFAIFGPDGGLALCNAAFAQIHGTAPARLVGRRFEELADAPAFRAALRMGEAAWAEWLAWRLAKHRAADGVPFEMRLGARWFLIREQRTRDGSVLLVRTDVTHLKHVEEELRRLATTDPLTGVANRRHFVEQGSRLLARASRDGEPASLALLDIDRFKQVNDTHGHAAGDQVLRQISRLCAELSRPGDLLARWGGEEFILLLPRTDLAAAFAVAERLRAAVAALAIEGGGGPPLRVTASFGVAQARAPELDELARRAERALYRAKRRGRDRVEPSRAARAATA